MNAELSGGVVRILTLHGTTAGTGFLASEYSLIATCAHVVEATGAGPGASVRVVFHSTGEGRDAKVEPDWWRAPDAEDVAILRLEGPLPVGVAPLLLGSSDGTAGHPFKTFGFPAVKVVDGMWGYGNLGDPTTEAGRSLLQLTGTTEVTIGFSGAPVLDTVTRRVVGMVTAITVPDRYERLPETAFIIPTKTLRAVCPELQLSDLCPYQGLAIFTEADAEFFFGRGKLVADLVTRLRSSPRFLAVVGPSGSGKSSVVQAGLFPALRRGGVSGSESWHLLTFRPGNDPFAAVADADLEVSQESDLQVAVRTFLEANPQVKWLVLFADQFEELFTLCPEPMQEWFLSQVLALLGSGLCVTFILTLRADFYGHLLRRQPLVDWLKVGQVNVPPMGPEELRAAVEEPALGLGLRFEPGLVETIIEEAGKAEHPLPLLESALTQLWEKREGGVLTHKAYQAAGRVAGAIGQWAEDTYSRMTVEEQSLARRVFTRLVHYGEGEMTDTRQRRQLSELMARPEEQETLHRLVRRLASDRLLVTGGDPDVETVEIIHDALLQQWGRLKHWTAEQREFYLWRQRLDERLQESEEKEHDEGALLRGTLLAEAERWLAKRPDDLNSDEHKYIQTSIEKQDLERQRWEVLQRQRRIALGRQLAAQAGTLLDNVKTGADLMRSVLLATESLRRFPTPEGHETLRRGLLDLLPGLVAQMVHKDNVRSVTFSPNGCWLATHGMGKTVQVWEVGTWKEMNRIDCKDRVLHLDFSPDSRWVATVDDGRTARVWDITTGRQVVQMIHENDVWDARFCPDKHWLVTRTDSMVLMWDALTGREIVRIPLGDVWDVDLGPDGRLLAITTGKSTAIWETSTGREITRIAHGSSVEDVAFSPDAYLLATASANGTARVWEVATGRSGARMSHDDTVLAVVFSPDGRWLATRTEGGGKGGTVRVWEVITGQEVAWIARKVGMWDMNFSPDGRWLATANADGLAQVWETSTWREVTRMVHGSSVIALDFSPDGRLLATCSRDKIARVWEVVEAQKKAKMAHRDTVTVIAFSPDGRILATGSEDYKVKLWEVATGQEITRMAHEDYVYAVAFSPDGRWLATGGYDKTVRVWDLDGQKEVIRLMHKAWVQTVAFSSDGTLLAAGGFQDVARVWKLDTEMEIIQLPHDDIVMTVAFSPNGRWLLTASNNGVVRVWKVSTGQELARRSCEELVEAAAFSPDCHWLATSGGDKAVTVWEVDTMRKVAQLTHKYDVLAVTFSSNGRWLATGSGGSLYDEHGEARVWEVNTGNDVAWIPHEGRVWSVAFSPDGKWLATGSSDFLVRIWRWQTEDLIAKACTCLSSNLSREDWREYLGDEPYRPTCPNLSVPEE